MECSCLQECEVSEYLFGWSFPRSYLSYVDLRASQELPRRDSRVAVSSLPMMVVGSVSTALGESLASRDPRSFSFLSKSRQKDDLLS